MVPDEKWVSLSHAIPSQVTPCLPPAFRGIRVLLKLMSLSLVRSDLFWARQNDGTQNAGNRIIAAIKKGDVFINILFIFDKAAHINRKASFKKNSKAIQVHSRRIYAKRTSRYRQVEEVGGTIPGMGA